MWVWNSDMASWSVATSTGAKPEGRTGGVTWIVKPVGPCTTCSEDPHHHQSFKATYGCSHIRKLKRYGQRCVKQTLLTALLLGPDLLFGCHRERPPWYMYLGESASSPSTSQAPTPRNPSNLVIYGNMIANTSNGGKYGHPNSRVLVHRPPHVNTIWEFNLESANWSKLFGNSSSTMEQFFQSQNGISHVLEEREKMHLLQYRFDQPTDIAMQL
eukprot:gb/GECG01010094.1/.p1 GENE.gb/GECG01010094.1/~~gb/GECG01010094.1/.p1  ORF type:complete len:214 (+),score=13.48 gb/GECG01010094.1/:1-642(+)